MDNSEGGADTFIPILILVVLRAQPKTLISNLQYIQRFRNPDKMQGENGYYMSSLNAAVSFIERLEHSVLSNITQEEFEHNVEQAIVQLPRSPTQETRVSGTLGSLVSPTKEGSAVSGPRAEGGGMAGSTSLPDMTRTWLFTTVPQLAEKAVSKPLNAIARIVDDLASSEPDEGGPGPGERHGLRRASSSVDVHPSSPIDSGDPARRGSRRRGGRPRSADSPRARSADLPPHPSSVLPAHGKEKLAPPPADPRPGVQTDIDKVESLKRAEHAAKLDTLAAIFPQLEPELLEVVLITHRGIISKAIDSLLEMS